MPESSKRIAPRYWFESVGSTMPLAAKLARDLGVRPDDLYSVVVVGTE